MSPARDKPYTVYVCPFTHWDRDWYSPFQVFRARLVELLDTLLEIFDADPSYTAFTMDGQAVPLEDYLEIRPQNRGRLEAAVRAGRLAVGPFYVLPDVYLVSAEALIRNLLVGRKVAASFGRVMDAGYLPDPFGHPRTMPSIMRGFGIDTYIVTRGVPPDACEKGIVFRWVAPDGAEVMVTRQVRGYGNLMQWGLKRRYPETDPDVDVEAAMAHAAELWEEMRAGALNVKTVLFNNGVDHQMPQPGVPRLIRAANRRFKDLHFVQGTYGDYARALRREKPRLRTFSGELHSGYEVHVLSSVLSARMWIKQMNFACQKKLEAVAEPLDALAHALRFAPDNPYIEHAWKTLLKTHPHDDICGCSVDEVHLDNARDFRQVSQLADVSVQLGLRALLGRMPKRGLADKRHLCLAFNPEPYARGAEFTLPLNYDGDGIFDDAAEWRVRRADGTLVPSRVLPTPAPSWSFFDPAMPACGYAVYCLEPGRGVPPPPELKARGDTIENALLRATLRPNGTVELTEKDSGRVFKGLNLLEDAEDVGDEYDYCPCPRSPAPLTSRAAKGRVDRAFVDPGHAEVSAELTLRLPASITEDRGARSRRTVAVPVRVTARLRPGLRRLEFSLTVTNRARDHRLRVLFPTRVRSGKVSAAGHFDMIERPVDPSRGTRRHRQPAAQTQPMDEWVAVNGRGRGALLTARGLPEYQAIGGRGGVTLALTLLRCVGWLSRGDLATRRHEHCGPGLATPGAQCLDTYTFEYAFMPYSGDLAGSETLRWAREFGVPCEVFNARPVSHVIRAPGGRMPHMASWLSIDSPSLLLSALKRPETGAGVVVRVYNPTDRPASGRLSFGRPIKAASRVRLDEKPLGKASWQGSGLLLKLKPHEIASLRVRL